MENNYQNHDEMIQKLQKQNNTAKVICVAALVCIAASILVVVLNGGSVRFAEPKGIVMIVLFVGGVVLLVLSSIIFTRAGNEMRKIVDNYAQDVLARTMDQFEVYDRGRHVDDFYIRLDLGFPDHNHIGYRGDYVKGVLKGVPLEFSEFELQTRYVRRNSDDEEVESFETEFKGVVILMRHNLQLSGDVTATQYKIFEDAKMTDDEAFNSYFSLRADNQSDIDMVFTPEYMDKLVELSSKRGRMHALRFLQDGALVCTIRDLDFFEMGKTTLNTNELIAKLEDEINDLAYAVERFAHPIIQNKA